MSKNQGLPKAVARQVPSDKRARTPSREKEQLATASHVDWDLLSLLVVVSPPPFEHHGFARNRAAFPFASAAASSIGTPLASAIAPHTRRSSSTASLAGARLSVSTKIRESGTTLSTSDVIFANERHQAEAATAFARLGNYNEPCGVEAKYTGGCRLLEHGKTCGKSTHTRAITKSDRVESKRGKTRGVWGGGAWTGTKPFPASMSRVRASFLQQQLSGWAEWPCGSLTRLPLLTLTDQAFRLTVTPHVYRRRKPKENFATVAPPRAEPDAIAPQQREKR